MDKIKVGQQYQIGPNTVGTVEQYDATTGSVMLRFNNNEQAYVVDKYSGLYPFIAKTVQRCFPKIGESKDNWVKRWFKKIWSRG